ncbi:MAG: Vitamin K epoxide reductase, partial [Parcubacteria group bacterium GW2011_GWF1_40_6]
MDSTVPVGPGKYDAFATCLKDEGAVFYGAFWCTHCQATKKMFGASQKLLPYVECSTADGRGQVQMCADKKIMSYPTWEFADGSRLEGEVTFEQLALKTSCQLPL